MSILRVHPENHNVDRIGWLRAAVLGANDGIVSTASLIVGVAAASAKPGDILLTGVRYCTWRGCWSDCPTVSRPRTPIGI